MLLTHHHILSDVTELSVATVEVKERRWTRVGNADNTRWPTDLTSRISVSAFGIVGKRSIIDNLSDIVELDMTCLYN